MSTYKGAIQEKIRIGALVSGGGSNLQAVIDACDTGQIDGKVVFVGSDNPAAGGLERARKHDIPTFVVDYANVINRFKEAPREFNAPVDLDLGAVISKHALFGEGIDQEKIRAFMLTRAAAESLLLESMTAHPFDLLILAGFMRKLTPYIIDRINKDGADPRIMNIHPALLPAFPGTDGYGDTYRYGCKVGGCTVHFVDYGEDTGPIIGQRSFAIEPGDTIDSIRAKGLKLEWELYPLCVQLFAQNRLEVVEESVGLADGGTIMRRVVKVLP